MRRAVESVGVLAEALRRLGIEADGGHLAAEVAFRSIDEVMASEAARFDRKERADGSPWQHCPAAYKRNRSGELRASMSAYYLSGSTMKGAMVRHGRYWFPDDWWPSPVPEGVRKILIRNSNKTILERFGSVAGARAALGGAS